MTFETIVQTIRRQLPVVAITLFIGLVLFAIALPHFRKFSATSTLLAATAPSNQGAVLDPQRDPTSSAVGLADLQTLASSTKIVEAVGAKLHLSPRKTAMLPSEIKAKAVPYSDILPIVVTDSDPELSVSVANALTDELASYSERIATDRYDELIKNLRGQIAARSSDLSTIDGRISAVSSGDFYVTPETGTSAIGAHLVDLEQQEQKLEAALGGATAAASVTAQQPALSHALARHEILAQDPAVIAQRAQLGKDIANLNVALAGYTMTYPGMQSMVSQVNSESASVRSSEDRTASDPGESESYVNAEIAANKARAEVANDRAQLDAVRAQIDRFQAHLSGSAGEGSTIAQLRRARAADEDVFTDLSQRLARANADRAQAAAIGSVVVIDRATDASLATLGRPLVLGAAFFVIFAWLAVTLAFVVDGSDGRLRTPEAIERLYGKPVFMSVG
jgi:capsular polysaccharide biosynthesis protein